MAAVVLSTFASLWIKIGRKSSVIHVLVLAVVAIAQSVRIVDIIVIRIANLVIDYILYVSSRTYVSV